MLQFLGRDGVVPVGLRIPIILFEVHPMAGAERILRDAAGLDEILDAMARGIATLQSAGAPMRLIGVRTRGVPLAHRIAERLRELTGEAVPVGAVDITLYRDDLDQAPRWPVLKGTEIPFPVDNAEIVLVDDVLFTGRTVRAALNAICDLGRPACVRLAVLVDRGHRELPIRPDIVGMTVDCERSDRVRLAVQPTDPIDEVALVSGV